MLPLPSERNLNWSSCLRFSRMPSKESFSDKQA